MDRYIARTRKSKEYTQANRGQLADPRVVNGFRPLTKEIVYQIVVERSKGSRVIDIDGNEYVDALNGFGMSLFGWQPDFVLDAVREQLDKGYEIGPQHPVAGEVAQLVCELTGHDRAALCNTGSEAVLGALRVARTVTARSTVVLFSGSYHGIVDEVIVRGTKSLRAVPAAPGILRNTAENVLVLDYGTPESMEIIKSRAHEIAAVLVEPVQSRRLDFRPVEFLQELRQVTRDNGALLIFDEVVTGFRSNPGGVQAIFGIKADLATLRQGRRRRLPDRCDRRQARVHGCAGRRPLAVRRRLRADGGRHVLRRHVRAPPAGAGRGQGRRWSASSATVASCRSA